VKDVEGIKYRLALAVATRQLDNCAASMRSAGGVVISVYIASKNVSSLTLTLEKKAQRLLPVWAIDTS
jgi:hypothetical protein